MLLSYFVEYYLHTFLQFQALFYAKISLIPFGIILVFFVCGLTIFRRPSMLQLKFYLLKGRALWVLPILLSFLFLVSCREKEPENEGVPLPVITLKRETANVSYPYLGSIEGIVNVEIRPQVEGILEEIYVDEGEFVKKGQLLFKINDQPYQESLKNAIANIALERAKLSKAQTEVDRLTPLVQNEVISEVRLQNAQADYQVAEASLSKAEAQAASMRINLEFTKIKAPVDGYVGRIPKRVGNLATKGGSEPLTILSDVHEVYVYFSMSESDFLFYEKMKNDSTSKKINSDVKLILADDTVYEHTGVIEADLGQINRSTGSITLRAKFPNPDAVLRLGNTGKVIIEQVHPDVILVPQEATVSIQDKVFVFVLNDENIAERREITIEGVTEKQYIVSGKNLSQQDRIVLSGLDKVTDGIKIKPIAKGRLN
jgi:membrane fusion protein (multidrug efflux system)